LGCERGDRVGIWSPNTAEWTLTQFATAKAGLVLVNVNPAYRRSELEYAMNKVECKALILAPALKTSNYLEIVERPGEGEQAAAPQAHRAPGAARRRRAC
jgi:fatty-acyl-CoA synthase